MTDKDPPNYHTNRKIGWLFQARDRISYVLAYEPSWFVEFGMGIALFKWGIGAVQVTGEHSKLISPDVLLPLFCIAFGPVRWLLLWRLWYGARVTAAAISGIIWATLDVGLYVKFGIVPQEGLFESLVVMDLLTISKFAVPCVAAIMADYKTYRAKHRGV